MMIRNTDIVIEDQRIPRTTAHNVVIPCQGTNPGEMTLHVPDLLEFGGIPELNLCVVGPNRDEITTLDPRDGRDVVIDTLRLHELLDVPIRCIPEIDCLAKCHREDVISIPV